MPVTKQKKNGRYSADARTTVIRLYRVEKWSVAQISRDSRFPSDPKTIRRWLTEAKCSIRGPEDSRKYPRAKILAALAADVSRSDIQEKYGCSMKYLSLLASGAIKP